MDPINPNKHYDIFISHSHKDSELVEKMCIYLEERGLNCWMSPRVEDNPGGSEYTATITTQIIEARIFVLVLTENANGSPSVARETGIASDNNRLIIPFIASGVKMNKGLIYLLSGKNPIIFSANNYSEQLDKLYTSCTNYLGKQPELPKRTPLLRVLKKVPVKWLIILVITISAGIIFFSGNNFARMFNENAPGSFSVTVFVHGKKGKDDRILKNQGQVMLSLRSTELPCSINEKGEATFKELPIGLQDTPVLIRIEHSQPYRATHPDSLYLLKADAAIYVEVALEGMNRIFGNVKDFHTELWLDSVRVSIEDRYAYTDSFGWFELNIPEDRQQKFQKLSFYKRGYKIEELDNIPVHTKQRIEISLKRKN